jgi:hypothetical protein
LADRLIGVTRRRALWTLALASVAVAAGVGLAIVPPVSRSPRARLRALTDRSFAVLAAVADRVCPGGSGLPTAWDIEVPEKVDAVLARLHPGNATDVHRALLLLDNPFAGLVLDARPTSFTRVSAETQDRILETWRTSRLEVRRSAYRAIVGLVNAAYWSDPRTFGHLGYRRVGG